MSETIEQLSGMGWIRDEPDYRDWRLASASGPPMALPPAVDLRPQCPPIYDQLSLGSCAANGPSALFRFVDIKQGGANVNPSRLFVYYEARRIRGWESIDSGAVIRDAMKVLADLGAAPEETWPYEIARFAEKPPAASYAQGMSHQAIAYLKVDQKLDAMKGCLAAGYPFVIGATLYDNFMAGGSTGMIPMPAGGKAGGHCFMVVGYRDSDRRFICQNSWGVRNHDGGFFYIPYDYLTNTDLAADAWTIRAVEEVFTPEPVPPKPEPPPPQPEPEPIGKPVIDSAKYKVGNKKLIVQGTWGANARLSLDGQLVPATSASEGLLVAKLANQLLPGDHYVIVSNADGEESEPHAVRRVDKGNGV